MKVLNNDRKVLKKEDIDYLCLKMDVAQQGFSDNPTNMKEDF